MKRESRTRVVDQLLHHVETHPSCYVSLSVLFKLAVHSDAVLQYVRKDKFVVLLQLIDTVAMKTSEAR